MFRVNKFKEESEDLTDQEELRDGLMKMNQIGSIDLESQTGRSMSPLKGAKKSSIGRFSSGPGFHSS